MSQLLPCQQGQVVTIRITTEQLKLLERACHCAQHTMPGVASPEIVEEIKALKVMCMNVVQNPGKEGTIYGFAL
jgi:hypothetical protein